MLKTRILTALVILPIILIALFLFPDWAWGMFTLAIAAVACWEWSRFCQLSNFAGGIFYAFSAVFAAIIYWMYLDRALIQFETVLWVAFSVSALFWICIAPLWLAKNWRPNGKFGLAIVAATGWVVIFPTWLAFLELRDLSAWIFLTFAVIVWVADVAAYFVGKAIGKRKLAPSISPGKTIEGAVGGLVGVAAYFLLWQVLAGQAVHRGDDWARELHSHGWILFGMFMLLGLLSVLGDLFESWMKRVANMKDSSGLLPGHGGVLDRIDALTSTLPVAGLYLLLMQRL